ncbi:MAG TPA: DUF1345 domain-containing protein [Burkholderiaceae bacterium]|nr:DUF1345 domain-containing protein [Burkholderiaceae bacterium]
MRPVYRLVRNRPRLSVSVIVGTVVAGFVPIHPSPVMRALIGWNVAVWFYLCLMGWLMVRANHATVEQIAEEEDKSAVSVLAIMSTAAIASIVAIVVELSGTKDLPAVLRLQHYAITALTVFGSWCLVAILFTFHYAYLFYRSEQETRALRFPENLANPDYWDFLYFSFTIAVAAQTSDVIIMNRSTRKTVLAQSILSFLFNMAILGFSINIAAGLLG